MRLARERGLVRIEGFDDPLVIAGQGTIGLELLEDLPEIDTAIVPLAGGGLISGIALALASAGRPVRVIGVSQDRAPVMVESLHAGRPIELPEEETLADALAGGIGLDNRHTFRMVRELVDETILVTEEEIAAGDRVRLRGTPAGRGGRRCGGHRGAAARPREWAGARPSRWSSAGGTSAPGCWARSWKGRRPGRRGGREESQHFRTSNHRAVGG